MDSSIINVALPAIKQALHFDGPQLQWVLTSYILTFGGFLMLGGRTADLFGRRRVLIAGTAGFTLVSLLIGLAPNGVAVVLLRALQGLTAAFMAPAALSILLTTFAEGAERNRALSIWAVVASGGGAVGVFLGGVLTQYLGWRACFFVNVPIGLLGVWGLMKYLPEHLHEARDRHLDLPGALLITSGLMALVYALTLAPEAGWLAPGTFGLLAASAGLLAAFVWNESRAAHPLVPLSIFRLRNVTAGNLIMLPVVAGALGLFYFVSLYVQNVLHYSPVLSGLSFLPLPIIIGLVSNRAPRYLGSFGFKRLMVAGIGLITLGAAGLGLVSDHSGYFTHLLPAFVLMGIGFGLSFVAITVAATSGVPDGEAGLASGLINTSQQIGAALGLAVLAVIAAATPGLAGYQHVFWWAAGFDLCALLVAVFVVRENRVS